MTLQFPLSGNSLLIPRLNHLLHRGYKMATKPKIFDSIKSMIDVGEEITAEQVIDKLIDMGRKEIPTKKSLSVKFKNDKQFIVIKRGRNPTIFKRIL